MANKAVPAIKKGNYSYAKGVLEKAIKMNPNDANTHYLMAVVHNKQGAYDSSIKSYNRAIALSPEKTKYYIQAGDLCYKTAKFGKAAEYYEKAVKLKSDAISTLYHLSMAYHRSGKFADSEKRFRDLITKKLDKPMMIKAYYGLTMLYYDEAKKHTEPAQADHYFNKAIDTIKQANTRSLESPKLYNLLGLVYLAQKKYEIALRVFQRSLQVKKIANTYYHIGNTYDHWLKDILLKKKEERNRRKKKKLQEEAKKYWAKTMDAYKEFRLAANSNNPLRSSVNSQIKTLMEMNEVWKRNSKRRRRR